MKLQQSIAAMIVAGGLILGLSVPRTDAATRYVWQDSPSPGPPYTSWSTAAHVIQQAVDAAQAGEMVLVTNGVYAVGAVAVADNQMNRVALIKPVVLGSVNGPDVTLIQGAAAPDGGNGDGAIRCVYVGTNAILSGFTLTNGHAGSGGGAWCEASGAVTNCTLTGNSANDGGGVVGGVLYNCTLTGNSAGGSGGGTVGATLYNCALTGNSAQGGGSGGAYASTLHNCTLTRNSALFGGGASYSTLYNCTLTGNSSYYLGGGVSYSTLYNCIVSYNTSRRDSRGHNNHESCIFHYSCTTPLPAGEGNIDADPQMASATHLSASSPCIGAGSATYTVGEDIDGEPWANPPCMGADQLSPGSATGPLVLQIQAKYAHVAIGHGVPFTALNAGPILSSVWDFGDGTRLTNRPFATHSWSAPGIYTVTLSGFNVSYPQGVFTSIQVTVLAQPVHYVNQVNPTPVFPYASWEKAATNIQDAVDAATLPGSLVLVTNGVYDVGGGKNESRVALTNPVVLRSVNGPGVTTVVGGGEGSHLRCVYVAAGANLTGFTLTNGHAGAGGGAFCESSGTVSNCVVTSNYAYFDYGLGGGGGAFGGTLYNCTLAGNHALGNGHFRTAGGGAANATLYNCILTENSAIFGGGASYSTLYSCTLTGNSALIGGGGAAEATLYNCALTGNSTSGDGGGAFLSTLYSCTVTLNSAERAGGGVGGDWRSDSQLHNCIVYYNTAANGPNYFGATFDYSCTTPQPTNGVGNIDTDPQLATTSHLSANSPCIGAGSAAYTRGMDIDGESWANPPCMGADQLTLGNATGPLTLQIQASQTNVAFGFPVSFTALNTGPILQSVWDFGDGTRLTNQPFAIHVWTTPGTYTVTLRGFNESFPQGVSTQIQVTVLVPVHYVNQVNLTPVFPYASWETAATNLQDAVGAATLPGSLVLVTNGIYDVGGGVNGSRVALTNPVVLRSVNGPEVTTIAGSTDLEVGRMRCVYVGANATLNGFTLTNGFAVEGGGVWCESSGVVSNCVITGNSAWVPGGGGAAGGRLYNCTLTGNSASYQGGGALGSILDHCIISRNLAETGGGAAGGTLYDCTLASNSALFGGGAAGSALYNCRLIENLATWCHCDVSGDGGGALDCTLHNCTLTGNSAASSGGGASGGTLFNCALVGNSASSGGGASECMLNNCILTGNSAHYNAGGAYGSTLYNCIVYHNTAGDGPNHADSMFEYSCTTPLRTNGVGNIDADPRFVNLAAGDFHLRSNSPCIDAGTNLSAFLTTDLDGLPRPLDGNGDGVARFDMGAYEFNPYRFAPMLQLSPDGFRFTVRGEPGKSVRIERSRDLVHWEFAGQVPIPASGQGEMLDAAARTESQLFYRAVSVP